MTEGQVKYEAMVARHDQFVQDYKIYEEQSRSLHLDISRMLQMDKFENFPGKQNNPE